MAPSDRSQQEVHVHWLPEDTVRASSLQRILCASYDNYWNLARVRMLPDLGEHVITRDAGHYKIENDDIRRRYIDGLQSRQTVECLSYLIAAKGQRVSVEGTQGIVIFNNEDRPTSHR